MPNLAQIMNFQFEKKPKLAILILSCFRHEKLEELVFEINSLNLNLPIRVFIDKYEGSSDSLLQLNRAVIYISQELKLNGRIEDFRLATSNLKTKKAWHSGVNFIFEEYDNLLYIEDDMKIQTELLAQIGAINELNLNDCIVNLYPPKSHWFPKFNPSFIYSDWPSLGGVMLSKKIYKELCNEDLISVAKIENIVKNTFENLFFKRINDKNVFLEIWTNKFIRAINSDTAWDTELHLRIWQKNIPILNSFVKGVLNTSIDETNLSKSRSPRDERDFKHIGRFKYNLNSNNYPMCLRCESIRYFSNGLN